jgi:[ribosomal protein S18]-alanine N-acetyltransferase
MKGDRISIEITKDTEDFMVCALMMTNTDPWITLDMDYDQCYKAFEGGNKEVYKLLFQNKIAGFVIIQTAGTFSGYVQTICIDDGYRGMGLGQKLMHFSEERIFKFSPNIFICVSSFNKGAIRLYQELGYKLVGELDNFVKAGFTELLLRKTAGPRVGYHY